MVSEKKLVRAQKLLRRAESQLIEFQNSHPEWEPQDGVPLIPKNGSEACDFFSTSNWQEEIDVESQMELDPTGNLGVCTPPLLCD